ncbi:MAG: hypothetical protein Q4A92_11395 [Corynebacterium sp.]|nr:hypothetical protein [Corynebacterium sp.]
MAYMFLAIQSRRWKALGNSRLVDAAQVGGAERYRWVWGAAMGS